MDGAFHFPSWTESIDVEERLRRAPIGPTVKGILLQQVVDAARSASGIAPGRGAYAALQDYPLHEWMEVLVRSAELTHPRVPLREGLRRLGHLCFEIVAGSILGKAVLSVAGNDVGAVLRVAPRLYQVTGTIGTVDVSFIEARRAIVRLRDIWDFPDTYHVGVYEGGLRSLGWKGEVRLRSVAFADVDLELVWS